ncbi:SGNH/GDSL hydrolase family protein [Kribbella sp. NPDC005582]|uniref:SGNH/GDSL hydrolase family protein n=1 Tax=Kribbella sp. NPDC005582 TaxID=3156893 RepID=UPI0033B32A11
MVFQGDSITDGGRGRTDDPNHVLGHSYPFLIASEAAARHPERGWRFVNRGVSGDKVSDLAARWQEDALDHQPDVLSVLVGVNGIDELRFESEYRLLLERTLSALPSVRLVLGEPFYLPTSPVESEREAWAAAVKARATIVRGLADQFGATFVPYQAALDAAVTRAPAECWVWDGIHPTYAGQRILADAWITAVQA